MSISNSARCVFIRSSISNSRAPSQCRSFHATQILPERRRPRFANVKAADMGLMSDASKEGFRPYEAKDKAALARRYTPEQLRVIEAGEQAIDPEDIRVQGTFRTDPYRLPYLDDLSIVRPVVDRRYPEEHPLPDNARWMDDTEALEEFSQWMSKAHQSTKESYQATEGPGQIFEDGHTERKRAQNPKQYVPSSEDVKVGRAEFLKYMESAPGVIGGTMGATSLAPALPKIPEMKGQYQTAEQMDPRDPEGKYSRLMKQTGLTLDEILKTKFKVLVRHYVTNQTRLGKIQSIYCLAIAGDGNGRLGIGEAKGMEPEETLHKARQSAIRSMKPIVRYEGRTIYGEVEGKVAACEVKLMARPPGFGLRVQHNIFEMARAAGIEDLAARVPRGRNKMNTIKATYQALLSQKLPDEIARGRGKKLVDVRKVYYGGDQALPPRPQTDVTRLP